MWRIQGILVQGEMMLMFMAAIDHVGGDNDAMDGLANVS